MIKRFIIFTNVILCAFNANAATRDAQLTNTTGYNYNYMYPYLNNQMRTDLNPGVTTSQSLSPINTIVRTTKMSPERRVVPRTTARAATNSKNTNPTSTSTSARRVVARPNAARAATSTATNTGARRVIARSGVSQNTASRAPIRNQNSNTARSTNTQNYTNTAQRTSSVRCLADYTDCMNMYCERENTAYNKCYCSAKLSQIDEKYQNQIDSLIKQLLSIQGTNKWSDDEMHEYWMDTVGKYSGENSWINLDNSLNIDWAGTESRVRGQNAFATGHEYCSQHLRGCSYMSSNLRDAYRSEISRDCNAYEESLQKIKSAAESIIEAYK